MSILPKASRPLRIISLPLTSASAKRPLPALTYYHFQISPPQPSSEAASTNEGAAVGKKRSWLPEGGVVNWATGKAASAWAGFGKAKEGSWKLRTYQFGERLVDRMDFEELALKGIDPSVGTALTKKEREGRSDEQWEGVSSSFTQIPLLYPPSVYSASETLARLRELVVQREPKHRKGFYAWMAIAPLTAPFMIIPVIPNLPFFFCVWRSWSHYRAYKSSQHLRKLLDNGTIVPKESKELDVLYENSAKTSSISSLDSEKREGEPNETEEDSPRILLTRESVPRVISLFELDETAGPDMLRAVEQARQRALGEKS